MRFSITFILLLFYTCLCMMQLHGQHLFTGIYRDIGSSSNEMIFYTTNGKNYVVSKESSVVLQDDILIREYMTQGMVRLGNDLNFISGPFCMFGREGYFFEKDGQIFYYDELLSTYEGANRGENPSDSLNYVYVKVDDLPENWVLQNEDRVDELGVINEKILYSITLIERIQKIDTLGCYNCIYLEGRDPHALHNKEYLISENEFYNLNLAKAPDFNMTDLEGKIVQMFFKWDEGRFPGYLVEGSLDLDSNKSSVPYEIILLEDNLNYKSNFSYPIPKN
jgi:hypothetical protein